jgi:FtsZ-binding cell division protein ZapB
MNLGKTGVVLSIFLISFPFFSSLIFAQANYPQFPFQTWFSPEALARFIGVPADWLVVPRVIYYVIVPFLVAVTVTYGILTELNIFRRYGANKINAILAVAMAFLLLPSGILTTIVTYFYAANTFIGLVGFGILFLFGVIMWVYGRGRTMYHEFGLQGDVAKGLREKIKDHEEMIRKLQREIIEKRGRGQDTTQLEKELLREREALTKEAERMRNVLHAPV